MTAARVAPACRSTLASADCATRSSAASTSVGSGTGSPLTRTTTSGPPSAARADARSATRRRAPTRFDDARSAGQRPDHAARLGEVVPRDLARLLDVPARRRRVARVERGPRRAQEQLGGREALGERVVDLAREALALGRHGPLPLRHRELVAGAHELVERALALLRLPDDGLEREHDDHRHGPADGRPEHERQRDARGPHGHDAHDEHDDHHDRDGAPARAEDVHRDEHQRERDPDGGRRDERQPDPEGHEAGHPRPRGPPRTARRAHVDGHGDAPSAQDVQGEQRRAQQHGAHAPRRRRDERARDRERDQPDEQHVQAPPQPPRRGRHDRRDTPRRHRAVRRYRVACRRRAADGRGRHGGLGSGRGHAVTLATAARPGIVRTVDPGLVPAAPQDRSHR